MRNKVTGNIQAKGPFGAGEEAERVSNKDGSRFNFFLLGMCHRFDGVCSDLNDYKLNSYSEYCNSSYDTYEDLLKSWGGDKL